MARRQVMDRPLVLLSLILSLFGVSVVYSAGQTDNPNLVEHLWRSQAAWLAIGIVFAYAMTRVSVRLLDWLTVGSYVLTTALLALLLVIGRGAGYAASSKSWLAIGGHRIGQPSELAKVTVVLMLARVLASQREAPKSLLELWKPAVVVGIPWLLIMKQPDLGTGIVFIGIFFAMLFWSGVPWPLLVLLASPGVSLVLASSRSLWGAWFCLLLALLVWYKPYLWEGVTLVCANVLTGILGPIIWEKLAPYQQHRLLVFLDPNIDARGAGYHVIQSLVAIGSGGWAGKGFTAGTQKRLGYLPAQHTDFIWSVVGEELGFIGVTLGLTLFLALFLRTVRIAQRANDSYSSLIAFGLAASWLVHVIENIGMTLNLAPITGIPLPFFSYGGSFMLACWLSVGILVRISSEGRGRSDRLAF